MVKNKQLLIIDIFHFIVIEIFILSMELYETISGKHAIDFTQALGTVLESLGIVAKRC